MRVLTRHAVFAVAAAALMAPSASWVAQAWKSSPQDSAGPLFAGLSLAWWLVVAILGQPRRKGFDLAAVPLIFFGLLIGGSGLYFDVKFLVAAAGVGLAWALGFGLYGSTLGILLSPSLIAGLLALPTTGYLIDAIWLSAGFASPDSLSIKTLVIGLVLVPSAIALAFHLRGWTGTVEPIVTSYAVLILVGLNGLFFAFHPPQFGPPVRLDESRWTFGSWLGAEIAATPIEERLFDKSRLSKRVYAKPDGDRVAVLIVESEDAHRLHDPRYCLTGSGWKIDKRETSSWSVGKPSAAAAELVASRGAHELKGVYWFSSDSGSTTDLAGLRLQNRLAPEEAFTLYMVTAISDGEADSDQLLSDFMSDAPWQSP